MSEPTTVTNTPGQSCVSGSSRTATIALGLLVCLFFVSTTVFAILAFAPTDPNANIPRLGIHATAKPEAEFPKLLHLMFIPYEASTQKLKPDENDFDHSYLDFWRQKLNGTEWQVKMWTLSALERVIPVEVWKFIWQQSVRPIQIVDFCRVWLVYHYGGVSLQYGTKIQDLDVAIPRKAETRLFMFRHVGPMYAYMHSRPQERKVWTTELANQLFSGYPHAKFYQQALMFNLVNLGHMPVRTNRDVLFNGGPGVFSHVFYNSPDQDWELVPKPPGLQFKHMGSWRSEKCSFDKTPWKGPSRMTSEMALRLISLKPLKA